MLLSFANEQFYSYLPYLQNRGSDSFRFVIFNKQINTYRFVTSNWQQFVIRPVSDGSYILTELSNMASTASQGQSSTIPNSSYASILKNVGVISSSDVQSMNGYKYTTADGNI